MANYHAIIYFRNGNKIETAYSNDERLTEWEGQRQFDQYMKTAIHRDFEPTRMVVVEDKDR